MRTILITFILMSAVAATAGEYSEVPKSLLHEVHDKLNKLAMIEESQPIVTVKGIEVVRDVKGRIFVKDTAEATVDFPDANLHYTGNISIHAKVSQFKSKQRGAFISRFGLATIAEQKDYLSTQVDRNSVYGTYQIFRYKNVGFVSVFNFRRVGLGLSHRLTNNTSLLLGTNWKYEELAANRAMAFAGVGFRF